jgi:Phycobilisome protein
MLSPLVEELIVKARIVSFAAWAPAHSAEVIARFQAADDERRYLSDADLAGLDGTVAVLLRDQAAAMVDEARAEVLRQFPGILEPGGGLYPAARSAACWRDFWHFLRCVSYGIAGQQRDYLSAPGLTAMQQLYVELQVPLPAMVVGVEALQVACLQQLAASSGAWGADRAAIGTYFDPLILAIKAF